MPHAVLVQSLEASSGHGRPVGCCTQQGVFVSPHHGPWVERRTWKPDGSFCLFAGLYRGCQFCF